MVGGHLIATGEAAAGHQHQGGTVVCVGAEDGGPRRVVVVGHIHGGRQRVHRRHVQPRPVCNHAVLKGPVCARARVFVSALAADV